MSLNLLIGRKNLDGTITEITVREDGSDNHDKLLYKYYRTPGRVSALINNGCSRSPLGIYISKDKELDPNSTLYNEEATMLPINIGFPEKEFYKTMDSYYDSTGISYIQNSEEDFFKNAFEVGFSNRYIYLYDIATETWTIGSDKKSVRSKIIEDIKDSSEDIEQELKWLEDIDAYIEQRKNNKPMFVSEDTEVENAIYNNPVLLAKYTEFANLAASLGIKIDCCMCSKIEMEDTKENKTL